MQNEKKIDNTYSKILVNAMELKEENLMSDPMLGCIYLDPRFQIMLTDIQKQKAKLHLLHVYSNMYALKTNDGTSKVLENIITTDSSLYDSENENNPDEDDFEVVLAQREKEKSSVNVQITNTELSRNSAGSEEMFKNTINLYDNIGRIHSKRKILEYWEDKKDIYPELYKVSRVLFSVPGTQVSVERAFSSFNFIFTDKRNSIDESILDDILLLRLNK